MAVLSGADLNSALSSSSGWQVDGGELRKTFTTPSFVTALALVNRVGDLAEAAGHHPDISINYNRVTFALVTHDQGGITEKDVALARQIDQAAAAM
ncbi:MAG: pterin-4-alpha-carbinolamine dehydratase [Chloroflexi bacterium]|nr:pterin-4-alpha-carbinolamine dehydratase [Chloroflexota bacterium]